MIRPFRSICVLRIEPIFNQEKAFSFYEEVNQKERNCFSFRFEPTFSSQSSLFPTQMWKWRKEHSLAFLSTDIIFCVHSTFILFFPSLHFSSKKNRVSAFSPFPKRVREIIDFLWHYLLSPFSISIDLLFSFFFFSEIYC